MRLTPRDYRAERDRRQVPELRELVRVYLPETKPAPAVKVADHVLIRRRAP